METGSAYGRGSQNMKLLAQISAYKKRLDRKEFYDKPLVLLLSSPLSPAGYCLPKALQLPQASPVVDQVFKRTSLWELLTHPGLLALSRSSQHPCSDQYGSGEHPLLPFLLSHRLQSKSVGPGLEGALLEHGFLCSRECTSAAQCKTHSVVQ